MSKFGNALSALETAKQQSNSNSNSKKVPYLKIGENETVTVRFLTTFQEQIIYNCPDENCTCKNAEIDKKTWEDYKAAGNTPTCPICGKPITDECIVAERPAIIPAWLHNSVQLFDESGQKSWRTFLCLANSPEHMDANGNPLYPCPICSQVDNNGNFKKASLRLTGVAVMRKKLVQEEITNVGQKIQKVVGVEDEMITDENGNEVPKIVIVQMSPYNFWNALQPIDKSRPIQFYDFDITRTGGGLSTSYLFNQVGNSEVGEPIDFLKYKDLIPDVESILCAIGHPKFYVKNGLQVQGYVDDQQQQNTVPSQQSHPQQPVAINNPITPTQNSQSGAQTAARVPFNEVANQFGGSYQQ